MYKKFLGYLLAKEGEMSCINLKWQVLYNC